MQVCIATGRNLHSARRITQSLNWHPHLVAGNGCLTIHENGDCLARSKMSALALDRVLSYSAATGVYIHAETEHEMLTCHAGPERLLYEQRAGVPVRQVDRETLERAEPMNLLLVAPPESILDHKAQLDVALSDHGQTVRSEKDYLDILPSGVGKAVALRGLSDLLGIRAEEVAALGDYENDLQMLGWAGFPAAVGNCTPSVRAVSKRVFSRNDEGGAAEFVRWIVYNGRSLVTHAPTGELKR